MTRTLPITQPFDLALSLEMGQAFRWQRVGDEGVHHRDWGGPPDPWRRGGGGWYSCVVGEYLVHIRQTDDGIEYRVGVRDGKRDAVDLNQQLHDYSQCAVSTGHHAGAFDLRLRVVVRDAGG